MNCVVSGAIALSFTAVLAAQALASKPSFYGQLHGELSFAEETSLDVNQSSVGDLEFDVEYAVGLAAGYIPASGNGLYSNTRYELEVMYREVDFDSLSNTSLAPGGFGGSVESYTVMGNVYYDFHNESHWTPYIGAGLGYAQHQFDSITIQTDDEDGVFAYQAMAGLAHRIEPYDNVSVGFGYRYFGTQELEVRSRSGNSVAMDYDSHNLEAFLRIGF